MKNLADLLTIVIPCKNEGLGIIHTLDSLAQRPELLGVSVIIADSSDDMLTRSLIDAYTSPTLGIQVIDGGLPAVARNNGAAFAVTPYILFLDADMVPLKEIVIDPRYDLSTCHIRTNDEYDVWYVIFDIVQSIIRYVTPFAVGGYMLWNRVVFERLGGFDENDQVSEDFHLSMKVSPKRFQISNQVCITSSRRLQQKGVWYMCKLMLRCWWNRKNDTFFTHHHEYWT